MYNSIILKYIDTFNAPYLYSAMAQVIAAILAITLTFRIILSQRLKYRFPFKIAGKIGRFEKAYFFAGIALVLLSLVFLMSNCVVFLPFTVAATIIWMIMFFKYYLVISSSLSLENLLESSRQKDKESLKVWWKKHHGNITKQPQLVLYDISIQAAGQKDFQYMEDALACLATLSDRFVGFVIRSNIGVLIRQHIDNSAIMESCLNIYYRLISPIAAGIKGKTYFFDERKQEKEYDTPEMHINNVMFRESTVFSDKNCSQVTMDLNELSERYLPLIDPRERHYALRDIVNIILSALADFECWEIVKSRLENNKQKPSNRCKENLTDFLLNLYGFFGSQIHGPFIEVAKDLSTYLNMFIIITNTNTPDTKGRKF